MLLFIADNLYYSPYRQTAGYITGNRQLIRQVNNRNPLVQAAPSSSGRCCFLFFCQLGTSRMPILIPSTKPAFSWSRQSEETLSIILSISRSGIPFSVVRCVNANMYLSHLARCPRLSRRRSATVWQPIYPAPPVTSTFMLFLPDLHNQRSGGMPPFPPVSACKHRRVPEPWQTPCQLPLSK